MQIIKFFNPENFGNSYAVVSNKNFVLIDCSQTPESVAAQIGGFNIDKTTVGGDKANKVCLVCKGILITHVHYDHICELDKWANLGASVYATKEIFESMRTDANLSNLFSKTCDIHVPIDQRVNLDGMKEISIANLNFQLLLLKGHSKSDICYIIGDHIFVGDLIFYGGAYGRYDMFGGDIKELQKSLDRLNTLPNNFIVHSGHDKDFELGQFKPYLVC